MNHIDSHIQLAGGTVPPPSALVDPSGRLCAYISEVHRSRFPDPVPLFDLKLPEHGDPDELLKHRFLCRRGGCLLVGPSGIGKSSFVIQVLVQWAIGRSAFGIEPTRPLKSLLIQSENDDGDLAEMREGVLSGMPLLPDERERAARAIDTCHATSLVSDEVGDYIREKAVGYDLVFLDPAFGFLGGDAMQARDVTHFLREVINPAIAEVGCAIVIVHHTNKYTSEGNKGQARAMDSAYAGSGSAEWTNWPRAILSIRSLSDDAVFELRAAKRGSRLRWKDDQDKPTLVKAISHCEDMICWRELGQDESRHYLSVGSSGGKKGQKPSEMREQALRVFRSQPVWTKTRLTEALAEENEHASSLKSPLDWVRRNLFPIIHDETDVHEERVQQGKSRTELMGCDREAVQREAESLRADWEKKTKGTKGQGA